MKFFITTASLARSGKGAFNALSKAQADVIKTLSDVGWKEIFIPWPRAEFDITRVNFSINCTINL